MVIFESSIQFLTLCVREANGLRHGGNAVPDILSELDAFRYAELKNVG